MCLLFDVSTLDVYKRQEAHNFFSYGWNFEASVYKIVGDKPGSVDYYLDVYKRQVYGIPLKSLIDLRGECY